MSIVFQASDHSYKSINDSDKINWISVTTLVSHFKKPFDTKAIESHLPRGHSDARDLVLKFNEHPHSLQHGAVPFTAHFFPF